MQLFSHFSINNIELEPYEFRRELSMEAYIIENEGVIALDEDYSDVEIIKSELPIKEGRKSKGSDGRIDLLALYSPNTLGIIELKNDELNQGHLDQLEDYFKSKGEVYKLLEDDPDLLDLDIKNNKDLNWIGILIGTGISNDLEKKINEGYQIEKSIPVAAVVLKRFRGNDNNIFVLTNTYFKSLVSKLEYKKA